MKYALTTLALLVITSPAMAAFRVVDGAGLTDIPGSNDFKSALESPAYKLTDIYNGGADVLVTAPGVVKFYYLGSESGYHNQFVVGATGQTGNTLNGGTALRTETSSGIEGLFNEYIGQLVVTSASRFSVPGLGVGFRVASGGGDAKDALAGTPGFGVFLDLTNFLLTDYTTGDGVSELYFGFDDNGAGPDDNHDDMLIRAVFEPSPLLTSVPEATSLITWLCLAGVIGIAYASSNRLRSRIVGA